MPIARTGRVGLPTSAAIATRRAEIESADFEVGSNDLTLKPRWTGFFVITQTRTVTLFDVLRWHVTIPGQTTVIVGHTKRANVRLRVGRDAHIGDVSRPASHGFADRPDRTDLARFARSRTTGNIPKHKHTEKNTQTKPTDHGYHTSLNPTKIGRPPKACQSCPASQI